MGLADLLILIQFNYGSPSIMILVDLVILVCVIGSVILWSICKSYEERDESRQRTTYSPPPLEDVREPSATSSEEESEAPPLSFSQSPRSRGWTAADTPSSPVGGTCLACGATVSDETTAFCPQCGVERQRCPICQRYVAGGQNLLACVHCRTPGHANEMLAWVEQHKTCPYCARQIDEHNLSPLEDLPGPRQRRLADTRKPRRRRTSP